jgi:shikimate kinase
VGGLSRWMGQPYDERYARNSRRYLELEVKVLEKILEEIERGKEKKTVVDTTGSVVYLPEELLRKLKQLTKVVYLETPESMVEKMIAIYFADPKPVIWGDSYRPLPDEEKMKALKRCYPALLRYRMSLYEKLADVKVDRSEVERLLDAIT